MDMGFIFGKTAAVMKDSTKTIRNMVSGSTNGQMDVSLKVNGRTVNEKARGK